MAAETGLSCSVGIGDNKQRAKLATGFAKPAGVFRLTRRRTVARVAVKVRFAPYLTQTRIMKLAAPTNDAGEIQRAALVVLGRFGRARPVRLLVVRVEFADLDPRTLR